MWLNQALEVANLFNGSLQFSEMQTKGLKSSFRCFLSTAAVSMLMFSVAKEQASYLQLSPLEPSSERGEKHQSQSRLSADCGG